VGNFYIDPWRPVDYAVITHAHGDHARPGHSRYLAAQEGELVLRSRMGKEAFIETLPYGKSISVNGVKLAFYPAGHVLGSAQIRLEHNGDVWVVSGDYKVTLDNTCSAFEPIRCRTFITESTFGLPIYRWQPANEVFAQINNWWRSNQASGKASVLYAYAFGKSQRILAGIDESIGPIFCHGAVASLNLAYRESGVNLPQTLNPTEVEKDYDFSQALILAPPSAQSTPWLKRFGEFSDGFASGWMQIRGKRRHRAIDQGFVLSDHADWPGLHEAIDATGAERIIVTHGQVAPMVKWLSEKGLHAHSFITHFEGEQESDLEADITKEDFPTHL